MYRHQNTGVIAEMIEKKENTVILKIVETGEPKEIGFATFKRWWKPVPVEAESVVEEAPAEETPVPVEVEAPTAVEAPPEEAGEKPQALSEVVGKLEDCFDLLNGLYFDGKLSRPIITVQSSPKNYGHCSTKKVWRKGAEEDGQYEINIGAEFLNRPSEYTAATLLHEMVHLYCRENNIDETCQGGRYHNGRFKTECLARDLNVEYDRTKGHATTLPTENFKASLTSNGYALNVQFARHTVEAEKKKPDRNPSHKYECLTCSQSVRTTQDLKLICGICEVPMDRVD